MFEREMTMTELQQKLVEMLRYFHELCDKEGITYFVVGGTALGATRHNGFIPWDDDVDVALPRKDYERLKALTKNKTFDKYLFEFPSDKKDFVYPYGKMYDTTTTLIENTRYKTKRGIYIDIFPLDGAGNSRGEGIECYRAINKKVNLLSTKTCAWRKGRKLYKNLAIIAMRLLPEFVLSSRKLKKELDVMSRKLDYDSCEYVANYFGNWQEKELAEKKWFGNPTEYCFEDIKVFGPENIDAYLTSLYGDWRTPPPKEKQITHHDYILLDLNTSYKNV